MSRKQGDARPSGRRSVWIPTVAWRDAEHRLDVMLELADRRTARAVLRR